MIIRKSTIYFLLIFFLIFPYNSYSSFFPSNFREGSEPDGFRGIKWGTDILTLKDMVFIKEPFDYNKLLKEYKKDNDLLKMGSGRLSKLSYLFWDGKFYFVLSNFSGMENWKVIRDICFRMFGSQKINVRELSGNRKDGTKYRELIEDYSWEGEITSLSISFHQFLNYGTFSISSKIINEEARSFNNKKARQREGF